jgi:hypothetical protein
VGFAGQDDLTNQKTYFVIASLHIIGIIVIHISFLASWLASVSTIKARLG